MKLACKYAIIQFMPYPETGEFANVGILLCAPKTGFVGFQLAPTRFGRVTTFFDDMNDVYREAIKLFNQELNTVIEYGQGLLGKQQLNFIEEVTRRRESLIRFGELRTIATEKPEAQLHQLYEHYVKRSFLTKEYRERTMAAALRKHFADSHLPIKYKEKKLTTDLVEVTFPLVGEVGENKRVIKPLSFDYAQSTKLIEHGDAWLTKVHRLIKGKAIDAERVLFTVEAPQEAADQKLVRAFEEIVNEMKGLDVNVLPFEQRRPILDFAAADLDTTEFRLH